MKPINREQVLQTLQVYHQPNQQSQQQDIKETQRRADHLWDLMSELYTDKWIRKNGAVASTMWIEAISSLTPQQLRFGVDKCKEKIFSGNAWAPDMADFLAMIHGHDEVDLDMAYSRLLAKSPEGRIEQWVYEKAAFNIRRESDTKARQMFKRYMKEAMELDKQGKLETNEDILKALPRVSTVNLNDIERENYKDKPHKFTDRINKLRKG